MTKRGGGAARGAPGRVDLEEHVLLVREDPLLELLAHLGDAQRSNPRTDTLSGEFRVVDHLAVQRVRIFRYTQRISTKLDPLQSPRSQLSNECNFVKIRSVYRKTRGFGKEVFQTTSMYSTFLGKDRVVGSHASQRPRHAECPPYVMRSRGSESCMHTATGTGTRSQEQVSNGTAQSDVT